MYRGVVQAGGIWSGYLTDYIKSHEMELPVGRGRIWRVVYGPAPAKRPAAPALSKATSQQLVQTLSNPKGWWRDTAQRLLVERGDATVAPALKTLAASAPDWRTKLHALWTLDGLGALEVASVQKALADANADVRAAGVRLSEQWLGQDAAIRGTVLKLMDDKHWNVRRQVAASIGEMPAADRVAPATTLLTRDGKDPIMVDATISSLKGIEADVLTAVMQAKTAASASPTESVAMLTAAVAKSGDVAAVQRVIDVIADASQPEWQRLALLQGLDAGLPVLGAPAPGGRGESWRWGGGGLPGLSAPGGRVAVVPGRSVSLPAEPAGLTKLASGTDAIALLAKNVLGEARLARTASSCRYSAPAQRGAAEALRSGRRDLQEPLPGLSPGRWARQGEAGREPRGLAVCDRRRRVGDDPDSGRRQGRPDRPDAAAWTGVDRRADRGDAHVRSAFVGPHGIGRSIR